MFHGHSQSCLLPVLTWPLRYVDSSLSGSCYTHPAVSCSGAQCTTQEETSLCVPLPSPWKVFPWHVLSEVVGKLTCGLVPGKESRSQGNRKQTKKGQSPALAASSLADVLAFKQRSEVSVGPWGLSDEQLGASL